MTHAIAVVAHPSRRGQANALAEQVGAQAVIWDVPMAGCTSTHRNAWAYMAHLSTEWSVILEDDAVPVIEFDRQLTEVLRYCPGGFASLYLGRQRPEHWQPAIAQAITKEVCWLRSDALLHTVGYAVRTDVLRVLAEDLLVDDRYELPQLITNWLAFREIAVYYSRPSIVNHADGEPVTPTADRVDGDRRSPGRTAWLFSARQRWDQSTADMLSPVAGPDPSVVNFWDLNRYAAASQQ